MPVTSTTIGGVNCWNFSGAVTDAEIKTAWAALIVGNIYAPGRALYFSDTCNMTAVQGGFNVNLNFGINSIILHLSRNQVNCALSNWRFIQTVGLSVANRELLVRGWNGTALVTLTASATETDGLYMNGGSFEYAVTGNPGGADPRYLNELSIGILDGTQISSSAFTEQEVQPDARGYKIIKGVTFFKVAGFPQAVNIGTRLVVYRSKLNTQNATHPVRLIVNSSICYVNSTVRRNAAVINTALADFFSSTSSRLLILSNWRDESWFGAAKTTIPVANFAATNIIYGGVLKKIQFVGGSAGVLKVYDSRSTTTPARSTFVETATADFLEATTGTTADGSGNVQFVVMGATATGATAAITRHTGQRYTFQKFGYRVEVVTVDVTLAGDDDLSAYAPFVLTPQLSLVRAQATVQAATTITNVQQAMEELHNLAVTLSGADSYNAEHTGNLFTLFGTELQTSFATVTVNSAAASKIVYVPGTDALTIRSAALTSNGTVLSWNNATAITFAASSAPTNLRIVNEMIQAVPTNLTGITAGTLTYNTNTPITVTLTGCTIGVLRNNGTGLVTVVNSGSTITDATDPQINVVVPDIVLTFTGLVTGSDVVVRLNDTTTVLGSVDSNAGTTWAYSYQYAPATIVDIDVYIPGYIPWSAHNYLLGSTNSTLPVSQVADSSYLV